MSRFQRSSASGILHADHAEVMSMCIRTSAWVINLYTWNIKNIIMPVDAVCQWV